MSVSEVAPKVELTLTPHPKAHMSVAEIPRGIPENQLLTPPQDLAAEQSVLGAMLLSKDAIADVVENLHENDFYKPAHATIFAAILDIYGRGEPADAITVSNYLSKAGTINNVGGVSYLHTLVAGVPTAANAGYYHHQHHQHHRQLHWKRIKQS